MTTPPTVSRRLVVTLYVFVLMVVVHSVGWAAGKAPVLAVAAFRVVGADDKLQNLGMELADALTSGLDGAVGIETVARAQLNAALESQKLGPYGITDEKTAKKIGSLIKAGYVVMGTITKYPDRAEVSARVIDVASGSIKGAAKLEYRDIQPLTVLVGDLVPQISAVVLPNVLIGVDLELTGTLGAQGNALLQGIRFAVKETAGKSPYHVQLIEADNGSSAAEASRIISQLVSSNVVAIIGPTSNTSLIGAAKAAQAQGYPIIAPAITDSAATSIGSLVYRSTVTAEQQAAAMARYAHANLGARRAGLLCPQSTSSTPAASLCTTFSAAFAALGGATVVETYTPGSESYSAQLKRIAKGDVDVLYVPGAYTEVGVIIKQARQAGLQTPILGSAELDTSRLVNITGATVLNGVYFPSYFSSTDPGAQAFVTSYQAEYNALPTNHAAMGYIAAKMLLAAVDVCPEYSKTGIRTGLESVQKFAGIGGQVLISPDHTVRQSIAVVEWKEGNRVFAATVNP